MSPASLKRIGYLLLGASISLLIAAGAILFSPLRYVVYADGEPLVVRGEYETVGEVVAAAGVVLRPVDDVAPLANEAAAPQVPIRVSSAREVRVTIDGVSSTYVSSAATVGEFLAENGISLMRTDRLTAGSRLVDLFDIEFEPLPAEIEIARAMTITILDGGQQISLSTAAQTVGDALVEANIALYAADGATPNLATALTPGMTITLDRAIPITILVDGQNIETRTRPGTVGQILAESGVGLIGYDYTIPALDSSITTANQIQVIRVTEEFLVEETQIPFEALFQATDQLEIDQRALLQNGVPGIERTRVRVRYENGVEVSRTPDARWVAQEPIPEIVGYGTNIVIRTIDTEQGPREYWRKVSMRVTSYMAQTSGKPRGAPGYGITASGVTAGYGVVAIDPRVVPFRSEVFVPGYGVGFAGDTGGGVKGRWIDLGYEDDWDTFESWNGYVDVYYLTPVPENVNYLIPTTLP